MTATESDSNSSNDSDPIKRFRDTDVEEEFKHWLREEQDFQETSIKTYWQALKHLPYVSLQEQSRARIEGILLQSEEFNNQTKAKAVRKFIKYQWSRIDQDSYDDAEEYADLRHKKIDLIEGEDATLRFDTDEITDSGGYDSLKEDEHYIRKADFVEFLRRVDPEKARFYAFQYFGGFRWGEVKKLTDDHWREPNSGINVGDWGGVRVEKSRSKSEASRTVNFYSDIPAQIFKNALKETGSWYDKDSEEQYNDVIFPGLKQSSLNYQLGRQQNGKLYGAFPKVAGEKKTLHSIRHTRVTDLVMNDIETGEVKRRTGHEYYQTTDHYTDNDIENPRKLEDYIEEHGIDLLQVIEE